MNLVSVGFEELGRWAEYPSCESETHVSLGDLDRSTRGPNFLILLSSVCK